jgi:hypothetical protein
MNDIFHERHMNNIIAADREQNIQVRPTTSTRIKPDNRKTKGDRWLECRLGVRCVQAGGSEVPVDLAANPWKNVNSRTAPAAYPIDMESARRCSRPEARAGATPGTRRDPRNEALESLIFWCPFESEVAAQIRAPRLLCGCEREKQTWSMLMAVSSGTS